MLFKKRCDTMLISTLVYLTIFSLRVSIENGGGVLPNLLWIGVGFTDVSDIELH